jgi:hypothetical protein
MLKAYSNICSVTYRLALLGGVVAALSACSQYQDNGLLGNAKADICPPGCSQSIKSDDTQISIKIMNASPMTLIAPDGRVDVSGECYPSLYPTNRIAVKVLNTANTATYAVTYYALDPANVNNVFCKNGRFSFTVDASGLGAGGYNIQAQLLAYDSSNNLHTNDADGTSYVTLRK